MPKHALVTLLVATTLAGAIVAPAADARAHHPVHHAPPHHHAGPSVHSQITARQHALQAQQASVAQRLAAQRQRAAELRKKEAVEVKQLSSLQQKLEQTSTELSDSQFRLRRAEYKLTVTQSKLDEAKQEFQQQQHASSARLRAIYKNKALDQWEALLTSPDMSTFLMRYHFFKRISDRDSSILEDLDRQRSLIHAQQRQFAQQRQSIARITEVIGSQKIQLSDLTSTQQGVVQQVKTQRQAAEQAVSQLEADSNQIEGMLRRLIAQRMELERQARMHNPSYAMPRIGTGRFMWPVNAPITSPFGYRMHPILGRMILHAGVDFGVPLNTPIHCPDDGEVVYAGWYGGYGKVVIIYHGGNLTTLFGHNSSVIVQKGQHVKKGQIVSYSGSTGMSTGPHMHFEVRVNGTPVNPMQFLH